jgi:beta-galactosidase
MLCEQAIPGWKTYLEECNSIATTLDTNLINYNGQSYDVIDYCDLIRVQGAETLAVYQQDFYAGISAVTKHIYGNGTAYYISCRTEKQFLVDFYADVLYNADISLVLDGAIPADVMVRERLGTDKRYIFLLNFNANGRNIVRGGEEVHLPGYGARVIEQSTI